MREILMEIFLFIRPYVFIALGWMEIKYLGIVLSLILVACIFVTLFLTVCAILKICTSIVRKLY
ncbi:hypothetical protein SD71_14055 [Cohnella kolymensis]|uniref:Uncharacterized protein n=1 Tax=Cohnella kolymensis TaxID=1590652 RepID=A0ABR5A310_9BACL|nr:hypothetical protein [Cohnella kolymensis]KIL35419.1 hypothetical protein SD71_14055 [Cohnella kolymensis]